MQKNHFSINNRPLSVFLPIQEELAIATDKNYLFDLSYLSCLDVIGDKSSEFLQGQLSCDLREVRSTQMQHGAMCNLQGRILALIDIVDWHGLHLIVPHDLLEATQKTLAKTALFSRVTLQPSTNYQLFGFCLKNVRDLIPFNATLPTEPYAALQDETFYSYHLGAGYYIFIVKNADIRTEFMENNQLRGDLAWHYLRLNQKQLEIYPESRGLFLPHRLGLQHSGYLSFNKGCYKGQEIIARTHYRAKLKHEIKLFTLQIEHPIYSGQRLLNQHDDTELGEVIDFCPLGDNRFLIAASVIFECPSDFRFELQQ